MKVFGAIAALAIAIVSAFNVNLNTNSEVSMLTLSNVEALAQEDSGGSPCRTLSSGSSVVGWLTGCDVPRPSCRQYSYYCLGSNGQSCRPGTSFVYYDCNGNETSRDDSYRSTAYCIKS